MDQNLGNYRILIVDDSPAIHEDFRKVLCPGETLGSAEFLSLEEEIFGGESKPAEASTFDVDSAYQGQEALAMVETAQREGRPYSLAFVDVRMPPGWDGVETITHIWKDHPEIQVVICSAYSDYSWEEILRRLGNSDSLVILRKPFDNIEVLQLAHALTRKWTATREVSARVADLDAVVKVRTDELVRANGRLEAEIGRRSEIEAALRDSEERFRKAFETTAVALAILRGDTQAMSEVNQSFASLAGLPRDAIQGRTFLDLGLLEHPETWVDVLTLVTNGGRLANKEANIVRADGKVRQTILAVEPLYLQSQLCLLVAMVDVTEQRLLESQLRQSQKMEAVGQLAAGVAHDFNNLLTVIHGHASIQLAKSDLDKSIAESFEQVRLAADRAASLTRQLLAFSRKQVFKRRPLDLKKTLDRICTLLPRLLGETVKVDLACALALPCALADETNVEQIILNLAVNARDAMPDGGTLSLRLGQAELAPEDLSEHREGHPGKFLTLTVRDTGCGMDEKTLGRLFEPFFTTKPVGRGTGLGLSTVYGIVKQHEGWIEVSSTVGKGSTFSIYLPATEDAASALVPAPDSLHAARPDETVLVVEDEATIREMVRDVLLQQGYSVLQAGSGPEALGVWAVNKDKVTLLLTDMVMPSGLTGSTLAQKLLKQKSSLKVLYTSGYSPELVANGLSLSEGVNFLPKPFNRDQLLTAVRQSLDKATPTEAVPA